MTFFINSFYVFRSSIQFPEFIYNNTFIPLISQTTYNGIPVAQVNVITLISVYLSNIEFIYVKDSKNLIDGIIHLSSFEYIRLIWIKYMESLGYDKEYLENIDLGYNKIKFKKKNIFNIKQSISLYSLIGNFAYDYKFINYFSDILPKSEIQDITSSTITRSNYMSEYQKFKNFEFINYIKKSMELKHVITENNKKIIDLSLGTLLFMSYKSENDEFKCFIPRNSKIPCFGYKKIKFINILKLLWLEHLFLNHKISRKQFNNLSNNIDYIDMEKIGNNKTLIYY